MILLELSLKNSGFLARKTKVLKYTAEGNFHKLDLSCQTIIEGQKAGMLGKSLKVKLANVKFQKLAEEIFCVWRTRPVHTEKCI